MSKAAARLLCSTVVLLAVPLHAAERAEPSRPGPPVAAAALPVVREHGIEYVSVADVARRLELKSDWIQRGRRMALTDKSNKVELEAGSREILLNGLRVFLGNSVTLRNHQLQVSRIDYERCLLPLLRPALGPAAPARPRVIVLDPGHGGKDSGKVNPQLKVEEKTLALDTAMRVKKLLESDGFAVVLTRSDDRFVGLDQRAEIARQAEADLFLSLHYNSVEASAERVTGVEVFAMTPQFQFSTGDHTRTDPLARVAHPGNEYDHWNAVLGYHMHRELLRELRVLDRGLKRARWAVLRLAPCPALLIEAGYLSHDEEARRIATPEYRQQIAEAVANGVRSYVNATSALRPRPAKPRSPSP